MKILKLSLIVTLSILVAALLYRLRYRINSEQYLPEPYVGPDIHLAAMQGDIEMLRSVLTEEPELLTQSDEYGNSPLHLAAYEGHTDAVQFLILRGADVNVRNKFGGTPLLVASYAGQTDVVKVLIASGADANLVIEDSEQQVLQIASLEGYRDYSHMYHGEGGIINLKVHFIASPLQAAVANSHKEIAEFLIANGADLNAKLTGGTALHSAAVNGEKKLVELLIANGAEIDARNLADSTPLCAVMFWSREQIDHDSIHAVAKVLIEKGADVNAGTQGGLAPLHFAAGWASKKTVQLLLSAGADINSRSDSGDTPLNIACRHRSKRPGGVIDLLHKHGAVRRHGKDDNYDYEPDLITRPF